MKVAGYINKLRMLPKALAQAPAGAVRRRVIAPVRALRRRAFHGALHGIDSTIGHDAGNRLILRVWGSRLAWPRLSERLCLLAEKAPETVPNFVRAIYQLTNNPLVLVNLARSALSRDTLRATLQAELANPEHLRDRMGRSQALTSGLVGAATLLLDEQDATAYLTCATESGGSFTFTYFQLIDSYGTRLVSPQGNDLRSGLEHSGFRKPCRNRLVITASTRAPGALALLFQGAETATVMPMDDLYGRADFSEVMAHAGACTVTVEHPRSRISRFSADYHRVHEDTREAAEVLIDQLQAAAGAAVLTEDAAYAKMVLADTLFFPCLWVASLRKLIASAEFDHVVIALGGDSNQANERMCRMLAGIEGLAQDSRIEVVSTAERHNPRMLFSASLERLLGAGLPRNRPMRRPLSIGLREFRINTDRFLDQLVPWPDGTGPQVLMALAQSGAYDRSSAAFCASLKGCSNLQVAFLGGNLLSFAEVVGNQLDTRCIVAVPQEPKAPMQLLHNWLETFLADHRDRVATSYVADVISGEQPMIARELLSFLAHQWLLDGWFARLQANGTLPRVVVITPFRSMKVAAFAGVARRFGVPSIALEPHGLNASYCRYSKISTDYYGVLSRYFVKAAAEGFDIPADRCLVVGSPRLMAPRDYDLEAATRAARAQVLQEGGPDLNAPRAVLSFFCQPSDWDQVAEVWISVLQATADLDVCVILKTHPEETPSRVAAYLAIVEALGAQDRVVQIAGADAVQTIEVSDIVLSGYSAAVVEAALYRRPVICVTNGDVDYPLNQHEVIDAPFCRSTPELRATVEAFLANPAPARQRAADFLKTEPQLVGNFGPHLAKAVTDIAESPRDAALRPRAEVPDSLFLDPPYTVYTV